MKKIGLTMLILSTAILSACGNNVEVQTNDNLSDDLEIENDLYDQSVGESECSLEMDEEKYHYLARVCDGEFGYIDESGNEVITCQYPDADHFSHIGLAAVKNENDEWGYIDVSGNVVIEFEFNEAKSFSDDGYAWVNGGHAINSDGNEMSMWGLIDSNGNEIIPFQYNDVHDFCNSLAAVKNADGLWGYIDENGNEIIPCQYTKAGDFASNNLACVANENGLYGFIDNENNIIIDFQYYSANKFGENTDLAPVQRDDGLWGYINSSGDIIIDFIFCKASSYDELGFATFVYAEDYGIRTGVMGYMNEQGTQVTENNMWQGFEFSQNGLAKVHKNGNDGDYGYINTSGDYVIPLIYGYASSFGENGWAAVGWDGGTMAHSESRIFYIDETGQEVLAGDKYDDIDIFYKVKE